MDTPKLDCTECGTALIPPHGRGRHDRDGNYVGHRSTCRCRWCGWIWFDDAEPVTCECGATVRVECDDGHAFAATVRRMGAGT